MRSAKNDILSAVNREFRSNPPAKLGVAVSGGGDSVALLHALECFFQNSKTQVIAATVDHGLRPEAADEVKHAAEIAAQLSVPHQTLRWEGWDGQGNLQDRARDARYRLLTDWARQNEIAVLALGHTADDQAETVLMRLGRAAGVDGLSGIPRRRTLQGIILVRPLLEISRSRLREYLTAHDIRWIDDPSNDDPRFERVRMRRAGPLLAEMGLTPAALTDVARHMASAREALDWYTFIAARETVQLDGGDVLIDLRQYRTLPEEIARRLMVQALRWIGGGPYQPRRDALQSALEAVRAQRTTTLHGCIILAHAGLVWICREYNAVRSAEAAADATWDGRWRLAGQARRDADLRLRALGRAGLAQCGDWRQTGRPYAALMSSPSVWRKDRVIAAPQAGLDSDVKIEMVSGGEEFFASIISH